MDADSRIYIAGHRGLVGSAILRKLKMDGYANIITKTSQELDLTDQKAVEVFFQKGKPEFVFLAAAKVGGIMANSTYPAEFIYENLAIQNNVIHQSYAHNIKKLLFLGSSCIYPKNAPQPLKEEYLLTGELEQTNEPYAIAKIAGIKMCQAYNRQYDTNFISAMPTNLYGPNDNFDLETSHVLAALIRKFHEAKIHNNDYVELWGTGKPRREFLFVDDLADACLFLMKQYRGGDPINIGTGEDITIKNLSKLISNIVGYEGGVKWDQSKPDGTPRKLLDIKKLSSFGWNTLTNLNDGIAKTYDWYVAQEEIDKS